MTAVSSIETLIEAESPATVEIRRDLHRHPELGYAETRTAQRIAERLKHLGIEHATGLARGTGVLGYLPATTSDPTSAPTVALRADIDALPITEQTGADYASQTPGTMHACGHDGHTANLLQTAAVLAKLNHRPSNVLLLFQPAEEGGAGADAMIKDGALDGSAIGTPVTVIFGLHGWPDLPLNHVATRPGPLLASADTFAITVTGKGGHAAFPHTTNDPVLAAAHITTALQHIASRRVAPTDSVVVSVTQLHAGTAHNIIPDTASIGGTVRALTNETRELAHADLERTATSVAAALNCQATVEWSSGYPVTLNHAEPTAHLLAVARETLGDDRVHELDTAFMGGEDFSFYSRIVPACFFIIGLNPDPAVPYPALHTPTFDFNDDALPTATRLFCELALRNPPTRSA